MSVTIHIFNILPKLQNLLLLLHLKGFKKFMGPELSTYIIDNILSLSVYICTIVDKETGVLKAPGDISSIK